MKCYTKTYISFLILSFIIVGCGINDSNPQKRYEFTIEPALYLNCNQVAEGVYKFRLSNNTSQTLERLTAYTNNPNLQKVKWTYKSKPVYTTLFGRYQFEIPLLNPASYTDNKGEANTVFAPLIVMKGDTVKVKAEYYDELNNLSYAKEINFIME